MSLKIEGVKVEVGSLCTLQTLEGHKNVRITRVHWDDSFDYEDIEPPTAAPVDERFDLYTDVIAKLRFEPMTRAEQHAQLERVAEFERARMGMAR